MGEDLTGQGRGWCQVADAEREPVYLGGHEGEVSAVDW